MIKEIETRRSIRKFQDKEIPKEVLKDLLVAAMHAPTARNKQEWRFVVSFDINTLRKLTVSNNYGMFESAKAAIVVCAEEGVSDNFFLVDCGAATQNILLEAKALGLGTCWCAIHPYEERTKLVRELFKIEEKLIPVALIAVGYPNEEKGIEDRYDENKVIWL